MADSNIKRRSAYETRSRIGSNKALIADKPSSGGKVRAESAAQAKKMATPRKTVPKSSTPNVKSHSPAVDSVLSTSGVNVISPKIIPETQDTDCDDLSFKSTDTLSCRKNLINRSFTFFNSESYKKIIEERDLLKSEVASLMELNAMLQASVVMKSDTISKLENEATVMSNRIIELTENVERLQCEENILPFTLTDNVLYSNRPDYTETPSRPNSNTESANFVVNCISSANVVDKNCIKDVFDDKNCIEDVFDDKNCIEDVFDDFDDFIKSSQEPRWSSG